jgi:hypothetical protein
VNSRGAFRVIARNAPLFAPGGGGFEPRMDTNGHELMQLGLSSPRSVLLQQAFVQCE